MTRFRTVRHALAAVSLVLPWGAAAAAPATPPASPEARLIEAYQLVRAGDTRAALARTEALAREVPSFQLAQLLYGDLLLARGAPGAGPDATAGALAPQAWEQLAQLRREAASRLAALTEPPPAGALPREFVEVPPSSRHAIAVDASRSRLYLFENSRTGLRLVADRYVSLGRLGVGKQAQGDQRTPLGVYFITSRLDPAQLQDFYGAGALPLNYPNELDRRRGRTGHGIWLHGVPSQNFARTPQSTDGCVVLANDDMQLLLRDVSPRSTPVVIARALQWVPAAQAAADRQAARALLASWSAARSSGDAARLGLFYAAGAQPAPNDRLPAAPADLKDVSILSWRDADEVLVVTFGLVPKGRRTGQVKRQYWAKEGGQWRIFFEGAIG